MHKTGLEDYYVIKGQKKMRFGYTTGSCAAAASKAAVKMLLSGKKVEEISIMTPKGIRLSLIPEDICIDKDKASCAIRKDGGDDPDTTSGLLVYASAEKISTPGILIDGGIGVGRVTKPGLSQQIGEAAINPVPRAMIKKEAEEAAPEWD